MAFGYGPPEERDDEEDSPTDFVRLGKELQDLDVGDQETDAEPAVDVADAPAPAPGQVPGKRAPEVLRGLRRAQHTAADEADRANSGRGLARISAALGGYKPDTSYWDHIESQGKQDVNDLLQRRGLERQGRQDATNEQLNLLRMKALLAKAQAGPKATVDRHGLKVQDDETAAVAQRQFLRKAYGPTLEKYGITDEELATYPKAALDKVGEDLKSGRALSSTETRAGNSLKETSRGHDIAAAGLGVRKEVFANTLAQNKVAGFKQDDANPHVMQAAEAKELGEAKSARTNIDRKVADALKILDKNKGIPISPNGDDTAELKLLMGEMLPLLTTSSGMKSFTEGHAHVFTDAMGSPISLANFINSGRLRRQLKTLQHSAHVAVETMANSMGQMEEEGGGGHAPAGGHAAAGGAQGKHGKVVKESKTVRQYEDGYLEDLTEKLNL